MNMKEFILSKMNDVPFFKTISMQIDKMDENGSRIRIRPDNRHENLWGNVHGGAIASLVDATCGFSVIPFLADNQYMMTASLQVNYFMPAKGGDLVGHGRLIHMGRRLAHAEANIFNDQERLIARGHASFAIMTEKSTMGIISTDENNR